LGTGGFGQRKIFSGGELMRSLLLGLVVAVATLIPNLAAANDQAIARHIMSKLQLEQQRGALKGFHVDMRVDQGTVWYQGFVSNQQQKDLILRTAQQAKNLGVVQVVDDITIQAEGTQAQQASYPTPAPMMDQQQPLAQTAFQEYSVPQQAGPMPQSAPAQAPQQMTPRFTTPGYQGGGVPAQMATGNANAPMPMARSAAVTMPAQGDAANLPGYSWPSYAAHPNYAGVSYPGQYSASAWPYIGPFYPYPQVPLGWRKVTLEWDDGWWWLDFNNK